MLTVHRSGTSWYLEGALDAKGGAALLREVNSAHADVRIDGSHLQLIDGAGLTALAVARCECRTEGREFAVTAVPPAAVHQLRVGARLVALFGPPDRRPDDAVTTPVTPPVAPPVPTAERRPRFSAAQPIHRFRFRRPMTRTGRNP
jgi:ABC-type transporter Mla MlaB component